ncbi:MAG: hypothetical protein JNJ75_15755 [Cyclobacteriaceae bacterium]|nr:hypothetical protein [Cyclobacteriaceae bacterium]
MKRLIVGVPFLFSALLLMTKFLHERTWLQSLVVAGSETFVIFFVMKYFFTWWSKKSEEQTARKTHDSK